MRDLFCAKCQKVTPHKGVVDANGEFLFTCQTILDPAELPGEVVRCDRFIKFPADTTPVAFEELVTAHELGNTGQVILDGQEKILSLILENKTAEVESAENA
jgi:hypothetical protein